MKPITKLSSSNSNRGKSLYKATITMLAAVAMLSGSIAPASALTFKEVIQYKIFAIQCAVMLITDPIAHLAVCGEGDTSKPRSLSPLSYEQYIKDCYYDYRYDYPDASGCES